MRGLSILLFGAVCIAFAFPMATQAALVNTSHSNIRFPGQMVAHPTGIDANRGVWKAPAGVDCAKAGGVVSKDAHGNPICTKAPH